MGEERRLHDRVTIRAEARIATTTGEIIRAATHDLSIGGAFIIEADLPIGAPLDVTLTFDENTPSHAEEDGSTVHVRAQVVRRARGAGRPNGIGIAFQPLDLDNRTRLNGLVHRGD